MFVLALLHHYVGDEFALILPVTLGCGYFVIAEQLQHDLIRQCQFMLTTILSVLPKATRCLALTSIFMLLYEWWIKTNY